MPNLSRNTSSRALSSSYLPRIFIPNERVVTLYLTQVPLIHKEKANHWLENSTFKFPITKKALDFLKHPNYAHQIAETSATGLGSPSITAHYRHTIYWRFFRPLIFFHGGPFRETLSLPVPLSRSSYPVLVPPPSLGSEVVGV